MKNLIYLKPPLRSKDLLSLKIGDKVSISGTIYTARDTAHKLMTESLKKNIPLPFPIKGAVIYYVGPSPGPPGKVIGAAGPTTSYRMDDYTPLLIKSGLKATIGKGKRNDKVKSSFVKHHSVYLGAIGGAGALISQCIKKAKIIAYPELGPEAIYRLEVENMPLICINDIYGKDLYEEGRIPYKKTTI